MNKLTAWLCGGLASLTIVAKAAAGTLTLVNGDLLHGELLLVEPNTVTWQSENFGTMVVDKSKILSIDTEVNLKVAGRNDPCSLESHARERWELDCAGGPGWIMDFQGVERALPYATFEASPVTHKGRISAAGIFERGNVERQNWDINGNYDILDGDLQHKLRSVYQNRIGEDAKNVENILLGYEMRWVFGDKWFASANTTGQHDEAKNIELRTALGLGIGYRFFETDKTALVLQSGFTGLDERRIEEVEGEDATSQYAAWRWAAEYRYKLGLGPELFYNQEALWSLEDSADIESQVKLGMRMPFTQKIVTEVRYETDYDGQPSGDKEKMDTRVTVGVGYEW